MWFPAILMLCISVPNMPVACQTHGVISITQGNGWQSKDQYEREVRVLMIQSVSKVAEEGHPITANKAVVICMQKGQPA